MNPPIRLLYAEDNPQDADLTRARFAGDAPEFDIEIVGTGQRFLERLRETGFDLLLLDHHLPDMDGLDVLKTLFHAGTPAPVVLVTGVGDEELVVKALRLGAATYIPKQGNYLETLPDLLRGVVEEHRRKQGQGLPAASTRRILYVENQPMDIDLTLRHFAEAAPHFVVDVVRTSAEGLARLEQPHAYDLALIDLRMPDQGGLDFVREAKARRLPLPPFIMVTSKGDEAAAIATLKLGAADYITKREGYLDRLPHAIENAIAHGRLSLLNEQLRVELAERKRSECLLRLSGAIWGIFNEDLPLEDSINIILTSIRRELEFDAVGFRLKDVDDFPYFAQEGFSSDFLLTENSLVAREKDGSPCRDKSGNVDLECTCGLVLSGRTDPSNPLFTKGGSAWTNDSFLLLDLPAEKDPRLHPRNQCVHDGYRSIALIPIRTAQEIVGLLQLNDRGKGRFTPKTIHFLEGISAIIGAALMRKKTDEALRESRELFSLYLRHSPVYTYIKEVTPTESRVLHASDNFPQMIGIPGLEVAGKTMAELFPAEFAAKITADDWAVVVNGEVLKLDEEFNGRHYTTIKFPILRKDKTLLAGYTMDITESKQAEEILLRSEENYRALFGRASDGIFIMSLDGKLTDVNESFARLHGYSTKEMRDMNLKDLDTPETSRLAPERMRRLFAGEVLTFDVEHYHKDGHAFPLEVSASLISSGGESQIQCFHRDITERKRAEAEKEKLQTQFQQAMKMEAVGRLAGGVAHDFNNLLTVITGYSELLLQKAGKESPMHGELEEIKGAGERAAMLTQQLLAFSRKQIIEPKVVRLDQLVADMLPMMTRLIGEDIALRTITGKSLGAVKIDPGQFQQILMNLVVNARDAMPDGGKVVIETANVDLDERYCALHPYVAPGRFVMLAISDTGKGMSDEVKSRIFEPFFTTKETGKGTGLGLATTYGVVKQANGFIEVHSEEGKGTTFLIYLPRVEEEEAQPEKDARPRDVVRGTETVLVVEDDVSLRDLCVQILKPLGYKVMSASNGLEAIAVAQKYDGRIDLLLTDVVMPGMNGREVAAQLILRHPERKVLFTSGYTDDAIVRHGVLDEGVSFIGKPYTPSALARKVREVLDGA